MELAGGSSGSSLHKGGRGSDCRDGSNRGSLGNNLSNRLHSNCCSHCRSGNKALSRQHSDSLLGSNSIGSGNRDRGSCSQGGSIGESIALGIGVGVA